MGNVNRRNFEFESDMRSAIYHAIAKVCFKWDHTDPSPEQIRTAVDRAIEWWDLKFFEDYYDEDEE